MDEALIEQGLHQHGHAAGLAEILGDILPARFERGDIGCLLEDLGNIAQLELHPALMRHGRQVQRGIGRPAGRGHHDGGILESLARADLARAQILLHQLHHHLARSAGIAVAVGIGRGQRGREWQGEADGFGNTRHGVGRELAAAGAVARAGDLFQRVQFLVRHGVRARRMGPDRLEHVQHGHVPALETARHDRAAIEEDRGHIQAQHGHHHARQGLVAACHADQRIIGMPAHGQLNAVGNPVARDQRAAHAFMAHGDAVGNRDGAELARGTVGGLHAFGDGMSLAHQCCVARRGLIPAGGDPDKGLPDVLGRQAHRVEIAAMGRARGAFGHVARGESGLVPGLGHGCTLYRYGNCVSPIGAFVAIVTA